jgi:spermidine synthase
MQLLDAARRRQPTAYYAADSGIGRAIQHHPARAAGAPLRIGVIGLGAGTIAALGTRGDRITFYEINPQVVELARDYFTFLKESEADIATVPGDARLSIEQEVNTGPVDRLDVLAVDAFSGDAVPVHLLTRESAALYWRALREDGVLAVHTTNRHLDLTPVVRGMAEATGTLGRRVAASSAVVALEQESGVRAAKSERVREGVIDRHGTPHVRHVVEIALGIGLVEVDGRRSDLMVDRQRGYARLEPAGGAEQMARHRLGR